MNLAWLLLWVQAWITPSEHFGKSDFTPLGENIIYSVNYGFLKAGELEVTTSEKLIQVNRRPCLSVEVKGKTTGVFDVFYSVNNLWSSYLDKDAFIPHQFHQSIHEGNFRKEEIIQFDHLEGKASVYSFNPFNESWKDVERFNIPFRVHDLISAIYYLRTYNFENLTSDQTLDISGFYNDRLHHVSVQFIGKEKVDLKRKVIDAVKIDLILDENNPYLLNNNIQLWLTDDNNQIPIKATADLEIGEIQIELQRYQSGILSQY